MSKSKTQGGGGELRIESRSVADLSNDPANARKHNEANIAAIVASLRRFGQQKPIVIDSNNVVRAGNGTLEAARQLGWDSIQCVVTSLKGSDAIAYAIADNRTAELAEWDEGILGAQLNGLLSESEEIALAAGFTAEEIEAMVALSEGDPEIAEDEAPEPPVDPVTKPGDLWILGNHRLLCGDSTKAEDVARLMGGEKAGCVVTDPPYGIGIDGQKESICKNPKHNRKPHEFMGWDSERPSKKLFESLVDIGCPMAIFGGNYFADLLPASRGWVYWSKGQDGLSMSDGELAWTNKEKPLRCVTVNRAELRGSVHPTQKPVRVIDFVLNYIDASKSSIYDPFLGSGTTLIAAEQLGRKCFGMEISPQYCDVIVARWEKLTGQKAVLSQ